MRFREILSIILALLISQLLAPYIHGIVHGRNEHGPDSNVVKKHTYQGHGGGCYKMKPVAHICPLHSQGK